MATVAGLFETRDEAEKAIQGLRQSGIEASNIGIAMQDKQEMRDMAEATGAEPGTATATGAVAGGVLGGATGLILSLVGAVTIPVIGPILAAGPLAAALTGAGLGAATGGLIGALTEAGISEDEARVYHTGVQRGGVLVTTNVPAEQESMARSLMTQYGSLDTDVARDTFETDPDYRLGTGRSLRDKGPGGEAISGGASAVVGGVVGAALGGPVGAVAGAAIGGAAGAGAAHVAQKEEGSSAGPIAGGATGAVVGGAIGSIGGPVGTVIGTAIGGATGGAAGDSATQAAAHADHGVRRDTPESVTYSNPNDTSRGTDFTRPAATGTSGLDNTFGNAANNVDSTVRNSAANLGNEVRTMSGNLNDETRNVSERTGDTEGSLLDRIDKSPLTPADNHSNFARNSDPSLRNTLSQADDNEGDDPSHGTGRADNVDGIGGGIIAGAPGGGGVPAGAVGGIGLAGTALGSTGGAPAGATGAAVTAAAEGDLDDTDHPERNRNSYERQ